MESHLLLQLVSFILRDHFVAQDMHVYQEKQRDVVFINLAVL